MNQRNDNSMNIESVTEKYLKAIASILIIVSVTGTAQAIERRVTTTIDSPYNPGSLRYEIRRSYNGDSIVFDPELSGQQIMLDPAYGPIYVDREIIIDGDIDGDSNPDITISGNHQMQVLIVNGPSYGSVLFNGLNITNGFTSGSGGCITNYTYREVKFTNSHVTYCTALRDGGGIYNRGRIVIENSLIANNSAIRGAGIVTFAGVQPTILESEFSNNNSSRWGGAIYSYGDGTLHIERSLIKDNFARGSGAGVFSHGSRDTFSLKVIDTTITNNFSQGTDTDEDLEGVGGGIRAGGLGDMLVSNSTLSNNVAGRDGGGVIIRNSGTREIRHTTIAFNRNDVGGLGPRFVGNNHPPGGEHAGAGIKVDPGTPVTLDHVLFSENGRVLYPSEGGQVDDVSGSVISEGYNLFQQGFVEYVTSPGLGDILFGSADLQPLDLYGGPTPTHALGDYSEALNAGNPYAEAGVGNVPVYDQRGLPRVNLGTIDIGAFER